MSENNQVIPSWLTSYINQDGLKKVEEAVAKVEEKTNGEIVPVVVESSGTTRVTYNGFLAFLISIGFLERIWNSYENIFASLGIQDSIDLIFLPLLLIVAAAFFARWPKAIRFFEADHATQLTEARARIEFLETRVHHTEAATGVLVFVSLYERKALVLGDEAISKKISQDEWDSALTTLLAGLKKKDLAAGMSQAIEMLGEKLSEHFPKSEGNQNELRNQLVMKK